MVLDIITGTTSDRVVFQSRNSTLFSTIRFSINHNSSSDVDLTAANGAQMNIGSSTVQIMISQANIRPATDNTYRLWFFHFEDGMQYMLQMEQFKLQMKD